ncbi:fungal-specific transcription factor domain-containing protein [Plectosphaerella cucumerina]|uniref:Fungal-specific transcription factor domain-containing protein n=1 Tax=Plectosphaerella cucumerina TaxID=40658 RepID=A0A8K0TLW4_9PEZI|nr:fungal-specific transcription factor domain-containing protein [Plectosphaerella cucumerina]
MDPVNVYRQGFNSYVPPRQPHLQQYAPRHDPRQPSPQDSQDDGDDAAHPARIAHTLTACCRCRQRKTRCDPTLPRCLPCERSGSICEYFDATKGRKVGRNYVVKLQAKVRELENELNMYTDEDNDRPRSNEDVVRPGGLVRLSQFDADETPRYLGPSSGIAMTRILVEQAKKFTDSKRVSDMLPTVRARRQTRMQSIIMTNPRAPRKKSYPTTSAHPARKLPEGELKNGLIDIFLQRSQTFWPTMHEVQLQQDLKDVYNDDTDPYKNFVVRMVFAISLQKLDINWAGLADSYYLAAMEYFEKVVRPKDIKTLQCLALICQYSLLTPTRVAIYYVVGLAIKICQAEGLTDEKTISAGYSMGLMDPLTLDMRRRLSHVIFSMDFGLAHSMGRPNGLSKSNDFIDVQPFATVDDKFITAEGIMSDQPSPRKLVSIHFYKMRLLQAEIKRQLYEKKRSEPQNETHPWFATMEGKIQEWLDQSPQDPAWCKPWFTGRSHQMRILLHRPSPQVPKPSARAAGICYDGAEHIIKLSKQQMEQGAVDVTWVFLLTLFMSLNTVLWTTSYADIRRAHPKEEVDELVHTALDIIEQDICATRWPGTASAAHLYALLIDACLQAYDAGKTPTIASSSHFNTPSSLFDTNSPQGSENSGSTAPPFKVNPPQFGPVFDSTAETMNNGFIFEGFAPPHPTFRSGSIFQSPSTSETGRRYSAYPPESPMDDPTPPAVVPSPYPGSISPPSQQNPHNTLPTPPESMVSGFPSSMTTPGSGSTLSPPSQSSATPTLSHTSPALSYTGQMTKHPQPPQRGPTFAVPPAPQQQPIQQRPLPQTDGITDWFSPPPPFISPYAFSSMNNNFFGDSAQTNAFSNVTGAGTAFGLGQFGFGPFGGPQQMNYNPERQGSLSQEQQLELMLELETDGIGEIDAFLNMGGGVGTNGTGWA